MKRSRWYPAPLVLLVLSAFACGEDAPPPGSAATSATSTGDTTATAGDTGVSSAGVAGGSGATSAAGDTGTSGGSQGTTSGVAASTGTPAASTSNAGASSAGATTAGTTAGATSGTTGSDPGSAPDAGGPTDAGSLQDADMAGGGGASDCDRACLTELMTAYLDALVAQDASSLPLSSDVRFTENGAELSLSEGLWAVAESLDGYRQDFAEVPAGQAAAFVRLEDSRGQVLLAVRLRVVERTITEIETIVARRGEATFFAADDLEADPLLEQDVDPAGRATRERLVEIADLYFDGLSAGDGSQIPFGRDASRNENGVVTASGSSISNLRAFSYIEEIKRRHVVVDVERGINVPFALFEIPNGFTGSRTLHIAELFKVVDDEVVRIVAIMVNQPLGTPSGWE